MWEKLFVSETSLIVLLSTIIDHHTMFEILFILNVIDLITGCIKAKVNHRENSMIGYKGTLKKLSYWIMILLAFMVAYTMTEIGNLIHEDFSAMYFLGWFVLASLIINECRSIIENLVEAGCKVPRIFTKGLEAAEHLIETEKENGKTNSNPENDKLDGN